MSDHPELESVIDALVPGRATVRVEAGRARIVLDVGGIDAAEHAGLEARVRTAALAVAGIDDVRVALTASRPQRMLIAVASGKGGVGKSTVAANLAIALHRRGRRVGMVDADIHGPSQPRLLDVEGTKPVARDKVLQPVATPSGITLLSMGQFVAPDQAIAWRGLKAAGALGQLVDANWGDADTLILDLPPGTGDIQLTMIRNHRPAGAVIVSTPQDLALIDARRAIDLFAQAGVPVIGLIENMAGYVCPACGATSDPFGHGGAEAAAAGLGIAFLGRIPLEIAIRSGSDAGQPPVCGNGPEALAFNELADRVAQWIAART